MKTSAQRPAGISFEPGKEGAVYPSQCWTSLDQITTGIVSAKLSQNLSRNIATEWPRVSPTSFGKTLIYPLYLMQRTLSREDREDELAWGSRTATARNKPLQSR